MQGRGLIDAAALGLNNTVLDLIAHAKTMSPANPVGFEQQLDEVVEAVSVEGHGKALFEANDDLFTRDGNIVEPEGCAHDGVDNPDGRRQVLQILGFVRCAQDIGVRGVGLLSGHLVSETGALHEGGHLGAPAELVDKGGVEPGLVDLEARIDKQTVAIETLDIIAFECGAVSPYIYAVFFHCGYQQGASDGAADGGGVEIGNAGGGDVEGAGLQRGNAFAHERAAAVDEARLFRAVLDGCARNGFVVGFVGLAEIGCVGIWDRALLPHPVEGG